jgi:DNA-binding NarL/FixJ family response regulator
MESPRVLVVEGDRCLGEVIAGILRGAGFTDLSIAASSAGAEERFAKAPPDLTVIDLGLSDENGFALIRALRALPFAGPILVLVSPSRPDCILGSLGVGADGCLFKDELDVRLAPALRDLSRGGASLSPRVARILLGQLHLTQPQAAPVPPALTPKERSVLELLATGASYAEIGSELTIQVNTVRSHIRSLYDKLGVENRAEAVNLSWHFGLLRTPEVLFGHQQ